MKIMNIPRSMVLLIILISVWSFSPVQGTEDFENDAFQIRSMDLGAGLPGTNRFSVVVANRQGTPKYLTIDFRAESVGLGPVNWQTQFYYVFQPFEAKTIQEEYSILGPYLVRTIVRFEEFDRSPETDKLLALPQGERGRQPLPKTRPIWRKVTPNSDPRGIVDAMRDMTAKPIALLNEVSAEKLDRIKSRLPGLIKSTRANDNPLRERLDRLFRSPRECPEDFDFRRESWPTSNPTSPAALSLSGLMAEPFSISGDAGNRIQAFFATAKENAAIERPLILLLSGNPPGTKEPLAGTAAFFAGLGYHAIAVDRRPSSRLWNNKDKFPSYLTDPVFDVLRLLDFLKNQMVYKISKIGIYGISAGAGEGKFIAALDDRIEAAVLACGLTSHDWLFRDEAWVPTYSGMMIFPELGLGRPEIGKLTSAQWEEYLMKLKPEHNARARKVFQSVFPFFEDLDPVKVVPLIAPIPLLIVTGAQDDQYKVPGVVEVDRTAQEAYAALGLGDCSELFIGPRIGHGVDPRGMPVIAAFFDRWLNQ